MTNHMRSDSNVPRSDEADLRRALEEAKDVRFFYFNVVSIYPLGQRCRRAIECKICLWL